MYQACGGMARGMRWVLVGYSMASRLYPKYEPAKASGTEMKNHSTMSAQKVPNGTAPDDLPKLKKGAQAKAFELTPTMKNYAAAAALALVIAYFVYGALKGPGKPAAKAKPKASKKHR